MKAFETYMIYCDMIPSSYTQKLNHLTHLTTVAHAERQLNPQVPGPVSLNILQVWDNFLGKNWQIAIKKSSNQNYLK